FTALLDSCNPQLILLTTCDSIPLASELARSTNVITASRPTELHQTLKWEKSFYHELKTGKSLLQAFQRSKAMTRGPLALFLKNDVRFVESK
ncbi:MAG TPA: hypothetical protein VFX98_13015, partial [Longimicrobiaceae bacterium]|nr:hypothetical protein [Longimicrobiaceae bacterium]